MKQNLYMALALALITTSILVTMMALIVLSLTVLALKRTAEPVANQLVTVLLQILANARTPT